MLQIKQWSLTYLIATGPIVITKQNWISPEQIMQHMVSKTP